MTPGARPEPTLADRLVAILERERRASRRALGEVHALGIDERVAAGEAVRGLTVIARAGDRIRLRCPANLSRFRETDSLWLGTGDKIDEGVAVELRDYDPVEQIIEVTVDAYLAGGRERRASPRLARDRELVLDRREVDLTDRIIGAVRTVLAGDEQTDVRDLLVGGVAPGRGSTGPTRTGHRRSARSGPRQAADPGVEIVAGPDRARREGLDPAQSEAFVTACREPFALVQGPPGSGKTRLGAAIASAFLDRGRRVLVTAFTHRAVNNLLSAVARSHQGARLFKIGAAAQAEGLEPSGVELVPTARRLPDPPGPALVGVTTHAAVSLLRRPPFDLLLVDEAGQISLAHACPVLPLGRRRVLLGDHRQLPPLVVGSHHDSLAHRSLFEHLHDRFGSHLLRYTYRMSTELCRFPSQAFYQGRLEPAAESCARRLELDGDPGPLLAPTPACVLVPMDHRGARLVAPAEVDLAADLVSRAVRHGLAPEEAAVIAPHRAQGARIRAALRRKLTDLPPDRQPLVDTVERLQGGERDLIVLSLTASDPEAVLAEASFFFSPNRLNVSLTRARRKLVILMSEAILDAWPDDPRALRGSELFRRLWQTVPHVRANAAATPGASTSRPPLR